MSANTGNVLLGAGVIFFGYYLLKKKMAGKTQAAVSTSATPVDMSSVFSGFDFTADTSAFVDPKFNAIDASKLNLNFAYQFPNS